MTEEEGEASLSSSSSFSRTPSLSPMKRTATTNSATTTKLTGPPRPHYHSHTRPPARTTLTRINVLLGCAMLAMGLQFWNVRGGMLLVTGPTADCREYMELIQVAPLFHGTGAGAGASGGGGGGGGASGRQGEGQPGSGGDQDEDGNILPIGSSPITPLTTSGLTANNGTMSRLTSSSSVFPLPHLTTESLVVMVLSRRSAFDIRQAIRDTWAQGTNSNVYFVVGQGCEVPPKYRGRDEGGNPNCQVAPRPLPPQYVNDTLHQIAQEDLVQRQLLREQHRYQDLLMMDDVDTYRTLPHKLKWAYTFVDQYLPPSVRWVLKVDDDFFVRISKFQSYLDHLDPTKDFQEDATATTTTTSTTPPPLLQSTSIMISGDIRTEHNAHTGGKWKEVPQWSHGALYPPFPLGSHGHVVSRPIVHYVATHQRALFNYQGEDVSLGIWLSDARHHPHVSGHAPSITSTIFQNTMRMQNHGDCRTPSVYVVGHDITPAKMKVCQEGPPPNQFNNAAPAAAAAAAQ